MATPWGSPGRGRTPPRATPRSGQPAAQLEQADQRLGVARLVDERVELGQRPRLEVDALAVVRHDPDRALVAHDLARDLLPVLVSEGLRAHREDLALVLRLAVDGLEARGHAAAASSSSARATSSMPSSAATETRS